MAIRMGHVSVVVDDLEAAKTFFVELGLEVEGEAPLEGPPVDQLNAIEGVRTDIAMLRTRAGHCQVCDADGIRALRSRVAPPRRRGRASAPAP